MLNLGQLKPPWLTAIAGILLHAIQDERTFLAAFRPDLSLSAGFSNACVLAQGSMLHQGIRHLTYPHAIRRSHASRIVSPPLVSAPQVLWHAAQPQCALYWNISHSA